MSKLRRWMESVCNSEPKWQEPMEWFAIGFGTAVTILLLIIY